MKNILNSILAGMLITLASCSDGYIDDITPVPQGTDSSAPQIQITSPTSTVNIPFTENKTDVKFDFSVDDDIELANIEILLDGVKLNTYSSFIDYRKYIGSYTYKNLALGNHTFTVNAKDLAGKSSSKVFNFKVTNVYTPFNSSEVFFVPFDNPSTDPLKIAQDQVLNTPAKSNSTTVFSGANGNAMKGDYVKYISYAKPNNWVSDAKSFSVSFWFKLNGQTKNNNGGNGPEYIFSIPSSNGHWSGGQAMLFFETNSSGTQIKFPVVDKNMGDTWFVWEGGNAIPGIADNTWKHCALVYDASTSKMTLYINGVANPNTPAWANHGDINMNEATMSEFRIGAGPKDVNNDSADDWLRSSWKGGLDQFRLFTTALSASEVKSIFDSKL